MPDSPVTCSIDLDAPGRRVGWLRVPRSSNTAGWASFPVPVVVVRGGDGPTALVVGGVHGDEPEGQVAALELARSTRPEDVPGRLIVLPCLSPEAARAHTRLWPSGANLNRSFPGRPDGRPDEQLAHFVSTELFPRADVVIDIHSGGRSMMCLPWSEVHLVEPPEQRRAMVDLMLAWNAPWSVAYVDVAGGGLLVGEAERQGKVTIGTELGGGGHVTAEIHRLAASGLANTLRYAGALAGDPVTRADLGLPPATILRATDEADYVLAPESGLWETRVSLGEEVEAGQLLGRLHSLEVVDRHPVEVRAASRGIVCVVRAIAPTEQADCVCVVGHPCTREELL